MKKSNAIIAILISLGLLLAFFVGLSTAQEPQPDGSGPVLDPAEPDTISNYIPIQGRLTDASGLPLNGSYSITMRMYNESSGGPAVCSDTNAVTVTDGLFTTYMYAVSCPFDGRRLFLGIEVESDGEMFPRQYIGHVPTAWTLRPGAVMSDTLSSTSILHIENWGDAGRGLRSYAMDEIQHQLWHCRRHPFVERLWRLFLQQRWWRRSVWMDGRRQRCGRFGQRHRQWPRSHSRG